MNLKERSKMSNLIQDSGGDNDSRVTEAQKLLDIIAGFQEQLTAKEQQFVEQMDSCIFCSPKQLFWLRDIKDKYL
jgi:hypothetical protein